METFIHLLDQYGYIILFLSLMLELIALPIPTEPLMSYVGYLTYEHQMNLYLSIICASLGSYVGMTIAYWIGFKLGYPFFNKYGTKIHLGPERLVKVEGLFRRYGTKFLLVTCFIPGVRHLSGYFTGISRMSYRKYSVFAGIGVFIWTGTFIGLGHILGPQYNLIEESIKKYMVLIVALIVLAGVVIYLVNKYLESIKRFIVKSARQIYSSYKIRFGQKLLITGLIIFFIVFISLSIGLIQDYFGHDFGDFNRVFMIVFWKIFRNTSVHFMDQILWLGSPYLFMAILILTLVFIGIKSSDRRLETWFTALLVIGGVIYIEGMRRLFIWLGREFHWTIIGVPAFPNDELILALVIYGYCAFILTRHTANHLLKILYLVVVLWVLFLLGIAGIFFGVQPPSGIIAGYLFGAVWLSFVILILEIWRLIWWNVRERVK
ncbi:MAG: VTT domain-containing protein [Tuberibacillus sp.]